MSGPLVYDIKKRNFVQCSWCDSEATHQLDSTTGDQCCDSHHARYFAAKAGA